MCMHQPLFMLHSLWMYLLETSILVYWCLLKYYMTKDGVQRESKYLNEGCNKEGVRLSSLMPSNRIRDHGHKLKHRRLPVNIRKHFFTMRVTKHWHRVPREAAESPSLEVFKNHVDTVQNTLIYLCVPPWAGRFEQLSSRGPCQSQAFCHPVEMPAMHG